MMYQYDLHIHTACSPCADEYMTPNNIVNMAKLNEVDIIAVTDHNCCENCRAVMEVGEQKDLLVIPGMEIESMEEFHSIALFPSLEAAYEIQEYLHRYLPKIKNRVDIFGHQYVLNSKDEVMEELSQLLITAVGLPAYTIYKAVYSVGGVIFPAHIDRKSYSVLSNLGSLPEELDGGVIELSKKCRKEVFLQFNDKYKILQSSDAHYLEQLCGNPFYIDLETRTIRDLINKLLKVN